MQLDFDRLYVGDQVIPLDAKVVDVKGYKIDAQGRILGKGHTVRDTVLWMIPVLWPIDLINLPRRGPRPTLKAETALTCASWKTSRFPWLRTATRSLGLMQRRQMPTRHRRPLRPGAGSGPRSILCAA